MSKPAPTRQTTKGAMRKERRADVGATGPLRKLKGLLVRPIGIERRDGRVQIVLKERRRNGRAQAAVAVGHESATPSQLCAELTVRLLAHEAEQAVRTMRHLMFVHDVLDRKGWTGVAAMSGHVLTEALDQLEMLAIEEPSPLMDAWIEQLRPLQRAAELRDERDARLGTSFEVGSQVMVSESDFAEFETVERDWNSTVPAGLVRTGRSDD